jgi:hypothetical protein
MSVYSLVPVARPTKFATVFGAWNSKSSITMSPRFVWRVAVVIIETNLRWDDESA